MTQDDVKNSAQSTDSPNWTELDLQFMQRALDLAKKASDMGEVPVGAVVVVDDKIVGEGWNLRETNRCALEHAEIMAIKSASQALNSWRLIGARMYVTLEPCLMCAGAIYQSRVEEVIFAAVDPKGGACGSLYKIHEDARLNHRFLVQNGLLAEESSELLKSFFRQRRKNSKE